MQILSFLWPLTYIPTLTTEQYCHFQEQACQKVNSTILLINQKVASLNFFSYIFVTSKTFKLLLEIITGQQNLQVLRDF